MSGCSREVGHCVASAEAPVQLRPAAPYRWENGAVEAGVAEKAMHVICNADDASSSPAASSRKDERLYDDCYDDAGIGA